MPEHCPVLVSPPDHRLQWLPLSKIMKMNLCEGAVLQRHEKAAASQRDQPVQHTYTSVSAVC